jgi:hypothetical protein
LTLDDQGIVDLLESYEKESKAIKRNAIRLSWFMRGGISYSDAMALSHFERMEIEKLIEDNLETTKKSGLAFF